MDHTGKGLRHSPVLRVFDHLYIRWCYAVAFTNMGLPRSQYDLIGIGKNNAKV